MSLMLRYREYRLINQNIIWLKKSGDDLEIIYKNIITGLFCTEQISFTKSPKTTEIFKV